MEQNVKHSKILTVVAAILIAIVLVGVGVVAGAKFNHFSQGVGRGLDRPGIARPMVPKGIAKGLGREHRGFANQSGSITAVAESTIMIKDSDNNEIQAKISDTTSIYNQNKIAKVSDLKVGQNVIISGQPNSQGIIQAEAINIK